MEQSNLQRNVGIVIGVVVIVVVVVGSIIFGRKSSDAVAVDQGTSTSQSVAVNPVKNIVPVNSSSGNEDDDEDNVGAQSTNIPPVSPVVVNTPPPATTKKSVYTYKNGTYSATGSYMSPGGQDQVAVTLTLLNDIVTSVSVTPQAGDRTSQRYINKFLSGYQQYVVGKDISTLNLSRVSGSSLTPIGFNNALSQIRAQAKA